MAEIEANFDLLVATNNDEINELKIEQGKAHADKEAEEKLFATLLEGDEVMP